MTCWLDDDDDEVVAGVLEAQQAHEVEAEEAG